VALEAQRGGNPLAGPYDIKRRGLGKRATIVIAFAADDCKACTDAIPFYKSLLKLPGMDGATRRLVVVAMDGLWPVKDITDKQAFEPHRLTSGPYPAGRLPGVTRAPTVLVLDEKGTQVGKWEGPLSEGQRKEIIAAASRR
jgi:hypothetical protein